MILRSSCFLPYITLGSLLLLVDAVVGDCHRRYSTDFFTVNSLQVVVSFSSWGGSLVDTLTDTALPETRYFRFLLLTTTCSPGSSPQPNDIDYLNYSLAHCSGLGEHLLPSRRRRVHSALRY